MRYTFLDLLGLNPLQPMIAYGGDDGGGGGGSDDDDDDSPGMTYAPEEEVTFTTIDPTTGDQDDVVTYDYMGNTYEDVFDYHDAIFGDDDDDDYVAPAVTTTPTTTYVDTSNLAGISDASGVDYTTPDVDDDPLDAFGGAGPDIGADEDYVESGVGYTYDPIVSTGTGTSGMDAVPTYDPVDTSYTDTSSISGVASAYGVDDFFPDDDDDDDDMFTTDYYGSDDKMDADLGVGMSPVTVSSEDYESGEGNTTYGVYGDGSVTVADDSVYTENLASGDTTSDQIVNPVDVAPAPAPEPEPEPVFYDMFGNEYSTPEAASAADSSYIVEIDERPEVTLEAGFDVDTGGDLDPAGLYDPQPLADVNVPIPDSYLPTSEDFMPGITGTDAPRPDNNDILNLYGIEPIGAETDPVTTPVDTSSLEGILEASDLDLDLDLPDVTLQPPVRAGISPELASDFLESRQRRGPIDGFSLRDPEEDVGLIPDDEVPTLDDAPITYEGDQEAGSTTFEGTSDVTGLPDDAFDFVETPTLDVDLEDYAPTSTDLYTPTSDELREQLEELGLSEGELEPEVDDFPTGPFVTPELTGLEEFEADMYESGAEGTVPDFMEDMSPFEVSEIEALADEYYETGAGSDGFTTDVYMPTDESFEAASEDMNALDELAETIAPDPDPAPAPVFTDSEGNEFSTEAERDESQGQIDARNRRNEIDDLIGMGVDPALATAAVDIGVDPTAISGTDAQVDPDLDLDVDVDADVADADTMTASEAYLSAMKKLDDPNSMTEAEQRALYGARGQVPNAAEAAYLQDLLGNARHKEDGPIGPDGQPIYRAGDYVTDQSFGDTLEDLFVSGFDLLVNPLSILGDKFTLEGQRDQYVEDQLDAYKNGGTFVYGEDGNTVVGVAEANFDADGDGVNDTVVLNNANGDFVQDGDDIIVGSGGISVSDVNINNDVDDDSEEYDIDVIYSDTTYTNTEDGVVEGTVDRTEEEIGDDPSDPCPEGFVLDPATGQCVPIADVGEGDEGAGKPRFGDTEREIIRRELEERDAGEGLAIRKPKQFARGGPVDLDPNTYDFRGFDVDNPFEMEDVLAMQKHQVGLNPFDESQMELYDFNRDGTISEGDTIAGLQYINFIDDGVFNEQRANENDFFLYAPKMSMAARPTQELSTTVMPEPRPTTGAQGMSINAPKQFARGGIATPNIDKMLNTRRFAQGGAVTPNIDSFVRSLRG